MIIQNANSNDIKSISSTMAAKLLCDPLFMYLCPEKAVRRDYINAYFNYYVYEWSRSDTLIADANKGVFAALVDPKTFDYKFKGKGAHKMKQFKLAHNVFIHRENLEMIADTIVPETRDTRFLTLYANPATDMNEIVDVLNQAIAYANDKNIVLLYDTFSSRLLPLMESLGFKSVYQKNFMSTQYLETVMMYNL